MDDLAITKSWRFRISTMARRLRRFFSADHPLTDIPTTTYASRHHPYRSHRARARRGRAHRRAHPRKTERRSRPADRLDAERNLPRTHCAAQSRPRSFEGADVQPRRILSDFARGAAKLSSLHAAAFVSACKYQAGTYSHSRWHASARRSNGLLRGV